MENLRAEVVSIRMSKELKDRLNSLALATTRRRSDLLLSWITEKLEQEAWQLEKIEQGLSDVENERYATEDDLRDLTQKWGLAL